MLDYLKQMITNLPCISFEEYYQRYVMDVQDASIDAEVATLFRNNNLSPSSIDRLINKELGEFRL